MENIPTAGIIVAAGSGTRMGTQQKKQYVSLQGRAVIQYALDPFIEAAAVEEIIVVVPAEDISYVKELLKPIHTVKKLRFASGGDTRTKSVRSGLENVSPHIEYVVVHDGARPFLSLALLEKTMSKAYQTGAAIAAVPVKDTIKMVHENKQIQQTLEREMLWAAQTPQAFHKKILLDCYKKAQKEKIIATDDASLLEHYGYPVQVIMGDYINIKLTTMEDLSWANHLLREREGLA